MPRPFIPLPNGVQVVISGQLHGQVIDEVHYVVLPGAPGPTEVQGVAEDFDTWFQTDIIPILSHEYVYYKTTATAWDTATGPQFVFTPVTPVPGASSQPALNNTLAFVISWHTANRGRSYRGRTFLAGMTATSLLDANNFSAATVAGVAAAYIAIPGLNTTTPYALVVASFFSGVDAGHNPIPRVTGIGTPINALSVLPQVYNMRRRRPGIGI